MVREEPQRNTEALLQDRGLQSSERSLQIYKPNLKNMSGSTSLTCGIETNKKCNGKCSFQELHTTKGLYGFLDANKALEMHGSPLKQVEAALFHKMLTMSDNRD